MVARDALRQAVVVGGVVGGIISGASGDYGDARTSPSLVLPANYAFAVWAPIYSGAIGYAVYQGSPRRRSDPLLRRTGWPVAVSVALSGLWVRTQNTPALQLPLIAATTYTGITAYMRALPESDSERRSLAGQWLVRVSLGLYAGWISVATVAATAEVLIALGIRAPRPGTEFWSSLTLAGTVAASLSLDRRAPVAASYPAVLAWGLAGITTRIIGRYRLAGTTAALATAAAGLAAARSLRRKR